MEGFHSDQYWFWMKRRQIQAQTESWEEKAFAEDAARSILNGSIWPPRFYSCNFCKREFRSAQALGGHMNIHRRDRARLKQNLSPQSNNDFINSSSLGNHCFPAKRRSISPSRMISTISSSPYSSSIIWGQKKIASNITREDSFKDCVETSLSLGMFGQKPSTVVLPCEEKGIICKRLKTNYNTSSFPSVFIKPCSNDHQRFLTFQQPSEIVLEVGVNHGMEDLDLELRLGKQQKVVN